MSRFRPEHIATVFSDLLTRVDDNSPVAGIGGVPPKELLISAKRPKYPRTVGEILYRHEKERWDALSPAQITRAAEAAADAVRRAESDDAFQPLRPHDPRVKVIEESPTTRQQSRFADRPMLIYAPGYSKDGGSG